MSAIQTINEVTFARAYLQLLSTNSDGKKLDNEYFKDPTTFAAKPLIVSGKHLVSSLILVSNDSHCPICPMIKRDRLKRLQQKGP
jgi:hypothetical protein